MKRVLAWAFLLFTVAVSASPPSISAPYAILIDADSGAVLYEKNADAVTPPASTTKMMTAILLIENAKLDEMVTISKNALMTTGSSSNLMENEKLSVGDLLYAIMLRSGNDACIAAAEYVSGSTEKFIELMNAKAKDLDLMHTHFANPNGLPDEKHYSTARDLALLAAYCMKNPIFRSISATRKAVLQRSLNTQDNVLFNHNKLLGKYEGIDGIKTGYTKLAGHCFVGSAVRYNWRIISVVLKSSDWKTDTKTLLDYGFQNFEKKPYLPIGARVASVTVSRGSPSGLWLRTATEVNIIAPKKANSSHLEQNIKVEKLSAPIIAGKVVGEMEFVNSGSVVASVPLVAEHDVRVNPIMNNKVWILLVVGIGAWISAVRYIKYARKTSKNTSKRGLWFPPNM